MDVLNYALRVLPALVLAFSACNAPASSEDATDSASLTIDERNAAAVQAAATIGEAFLKERVTVLADDQFGGRDNLSGGNAAARQWLLADIPKLGLLPAFAGSFEQGFDKGTNLCALVAGDDPALSGEHVIIGAHYDGLGTAGVKGSQCVAPKDSEDKICNGAIDNAAGVAAVLFVGKALASAKRKPRRTVVLCLFDAEEDGLLGSYHMTKKAPVVPLADTVAMMSMDNVGSRIFAKHSSSFATDAEYSDALKAHVLATNEATGYTTWPVSSFFVGKQGGGRSDHFPFREAGIPVLFLGSGSNAVYHTVHDHLSKLDLGKLHEIAKHATLLTARIANADTRPDFQTAPKPHLDDARAMVSIADKIIADPTSLNLNDAQVDLAKQWRADLQQWLDTPPKTDAEWTEYQTLVKAIIAAVFVFAG